MNRLGVSVISVSVPPFEAPAQPPASPVRPARRRASSFLLSAGLAAALALPFGPVPLPAPRAAAEAPAAKTETPKPKVETERAKAPAPADALAVTIPESVEADPDNLDAVVPVQTNATTLLNRIPKESGILVWPQYRPGATLPYTYYLTRCNPKKAPGNWEFIVFGTDAKGGAALSVCVVKVGTAPPPVPPPPVPPGPTPPGPTPTPAPIPGDGLRVLIVHESADASKLTPGQNAAIYGKTVRDYLQSHCADDPAVKGWKAYRIWDKDTDTSSEHASWQAAMKRDRKSLPWLVVSNPGKGGGWEGPLPGTVEDTMKILKQFGGD